MKKIKFFASLMKERDWLEEMAKQGYLLTNITLGILYTFEECEPCEKVYEVEHFAISSNPSVADLTARTNAIDVATQFGWEMVTHDESMNYYFVKNKEGDDCDEFYNEPETRRERAERIRKYLAIEQPLSLLLGEIFISALYILICLFIIDDIGDQRKLLLIYLLFTTFEIICLFFNIHCGQRNYTELCMSREEWEHRKKYSEKKSFKKVQQLRSYLQEKSEFGLSLTDYQDGLYLFEKDDTRYNYFVDTRACLKKRLKKEGISFTDESKDWSNISLKWYETSMVNAAQYGLKPVAVIDKSILIYKRPYSDAKLPWENGNENLSFKNVSLAGAIIMLVAFLAGFISGFVGYIFL